MKPAPAITDDTRHVWSYPEGWFKVAHSEDIAPGEVVTKHYFGRELVLFRTQSGVIQMVDAHCAHLGAHLGVGGTVVGEHLRCPFHAWEYGTDGICKKIPYSPKVPPNAAVGAWPTQEHAGLVFVWHSEAGNEPSWEPPVFEEYGDPAWEGFTRYSWVIHTSPQEICENAVDIGHLPFVHGNGISEAAQQAQTYGLAPLKATFADHLFDFEFDFAGKDAADAYHKGRYYGLGLTISKSLGKGGKCFLTGRTPIDRGSTEVTYAMLTAINLPRDPDGELSRADARMNVGEFEKDIPIWNNKAFRARPVLCKNDGPIGRFRTWASQFYPGGEPVMAAHISSREVEPAEAM
jgi:phenylpropionate dioxygenase-like ring-hydroxylating dioxygenase large terminal subunit